jgi:hypothetical protein
MGLHYHGFIKCNFIEIWYDNQAEDLRNQAFSPLGLQKDEGWYILLLSLSENFYHFRILELLYTKRSQDFFYINKYNKQVFVIG